MNKEEVFVGIRNPSVIARAISNYNESVSEFGERLGDLLDTRKEFDMTKIQFLDELMDFVQEYANLKQQIPVVKFKTLDHKNVKKRLREKVKKKKVELEEQNARKVAETLRKQVKAPEQPSGDIIRIKNFRKDLENLNKQLESLSF